MTEPTVTRRFSQALLEAATRLGIHLPALAAGEERIRLDVHDALWAQLAAASDDPLIGLQLALHLQVGHLDVAGLLLMSCETLGEALERYTEYHPIVSQGGEVWCHPAGSQMALCYAGHYEVCREARAEMSLACAMHIARWCTGDEFEASAVEFRHASRDAVSRYAELLGCEVHFEAPEDRVLFSQDLLSRPLIQANPALRDQLRELADQSLARLGDRSFAATVAETVQRHPAGHGAHIDDDAASLFQHRQAVVGQRHGRLPVHGHDPVEHVQLRAADRGAMGNTGIVDQAVQAPGLLLDELDDVTTKRGLREVAATGDDPLGRSQLALPCGQQFGVHVHQHHGVATAVQALGDLPAQTTGGAGNQGDEGGGLGGHGRTPAGQDIGPSVPDGRLGRCWCDDALGDAGRGDQLAARFLSLIHISEPTRPY